MTKRLTTGREHKAKGDSPVQSENSTGKAKQPGSKRTPSKNPGAGEKKSTNKGKRATREQMNARIAAFWALLEKANRSAQRTVSSRAFRTETESLGKKVTWSAIKATLQQMRRMQQPAGTKLIVGDKEAYLSRVSETVIEQRERQRPTTKSRLGQLLWKVLFEVDAGPQPLGRGEYQAGPWSGPLKDKIARLRSKSPVVLIDAGSTTKAVVAQLLEMERIPFEVNLGGRGPEQEYKLVAPRIVTNSPPIAELISNSDKHRREIKVSLVGGDYRPDHKAVCGSVTQLFLEHSLNLLGDLAVIGATGYREGTAGVGASFCCDDFDERNLKASFLQMAWFRVLVLDSTKLRYPELHSPFAPLSPSTIDLVLIDDGVEVGLAKQVSLFLGEAKRAGVATAILKTWVR
jgi:DeoR/GlpR family transcriptional regulator of sugar metabolism